MTIRGAAACLAALAIGLALGGCNRTVGGRATPPAAVEQGAVHDPDELERTWARAEVLTPNLAEVGRAAPRMGDPATARLLAALPPGRRFPVVVYLHGCKGIDWRGNGGDFWPRLAAEEGVVVVAPDSFARSGRQAECGRQGPWVRAMRWAEIDHAVEQLRQAPWADTTRLVLVGHSEGGEYASVYEGDAFAGIVIASAACWKGLHTAPGVPVMAVVSRDDPRIAGHTCEAADVHLPLAGRTHEVFELARVQAAFRRFLAGVLGR